MKMYRDALAVQNACNLSGVVRSFAQATEAIWEEARAKGMGTEWVNTHPVSVLFTAQIVWLSCGSSVPMDLYNGAVEACEKALAETKE